MSESPEFAQPVLDDGLPHTTWSVPPAVLALDEHLFNPDATQWLLIDSHNQAVKGSVAPTLVDGLELIGRGRIAALVGHLRDGAGVVDVDIAGALGDVVAGELTEWLRRRDCWVLQRPSGGAAGRWHIFFAHPGFHWAPAARRTGLAATIGTFLAGMASDLKIPATHLDLREAVRPLSSPHRTGLHTKPQGDLREALRALKRALPGRPAPTILRPRPKATAGQPETDATGQVIPLALQRWKRPPHAQWRHYLNTGQIPDGHWATGHSRAHREALDRSLIEAACTRELVWAVGDPALAWQMIRQSHPSAMTKAKHQGHAWWLAYVWNDLVRTAGAFTTDAAPSEPQERADVPEDVQLAVAAARAHLDELKWSVPSRQRAALLLVGHHLLDRMLREGRSRIPCPERNLVLDTGLSDRKTIRSALSRLNGRLGTLHTDCLSRSDRDSTSYEFEINPADSAGVRQIPPPVLDTPRPRRGLWATLPRTSHTLWRTLLISPSALDLAEVAEQAGLVEARGDSASKSQRTTAKAALVALNAAGLVQVDEYGGWRAASRPRSVQIDEAAAAAYERQEATVEAERAAYRAASSSSWTAGRARAIKAARAREKAWWDNLSPAAQAERRAAKRLEFQQMSITDQEALKAHLADRRATAGIREIDQYKAWLDALSSEEFVVRSREHAQRFKALSAAERGAAIAAWNRHRLRYGLTSQRTGTPFVDTQDPGGMFAAVLPNSAAERDAALLERQGTLFDHACTVAS